jgi:hypothetical protein
VRVGDRTQVMDRGVVPRDLVHPPAQRTVAGDRPLPLGQSASDLQQEGDPLLVREPTRVKEIIAASPAGLRRGPLNGCWSDPPLGFISQRLLDRAPPGSLGIGRADGLPRGPLRDAQRVRPHERSRLGTADALYQRPGHRCARGACSRTAVEREAQRRIRTCPPATSPC